ncbi:sulfotransferase [Psychroserpens mesophilus]|uniref:sulfotransferase n=1 Tax=Psychroserpens mesophilus TaxID=325473 RepID=UPI003F4998AA
MAQKKHKVIVIGLPKTGTSTLAVMLRMLNYKVTGPNIDYAKGDNTLLNLLYEDYDGFQDYPWCFEWQKFLKDPKVKFIVLKREKESWYRSFYESYGGKEDRYLSYSFIEISKHPDNKQKFLNYFDNYYDNVSSYIENEPNRFIEVSVNSLEWPELCDFLDEDLPTNIFGKAITKPHINKNNVKTVKSFKYKVLNSIKKSITSIIGVDNWLKLVIFLRKNNII